MVEIIFCMMLRNASFSFPTLIGCLWGDIVKVKTSRMSNNYQRINVGMKFLSGEGIRISNTTLLFSSLIVRLPWPITHDP